MTGESEKALADFTQAIRLRPDYVWCICENTIYREAMDANTHVRHHNLLMGQRNGANDVGQGWEWAIASDSSTICL